MTETLRTVAPSPALPDASFITRCVTMRYGPIVLRFSGANSGLRLRLVYPHTLFRVGDDSVADCVIECEFGVPEPIASATVTSIAAVWELRRAGDGREQAHYTQHVEGGPRLSLMTLTLEPDFRSARVVRRPDQKYDSVMTIGYPIDEYLVARILGRRNGAILHASSVLDGDGAYLFLGHSGSGKSTIAEIASRAGARVLTDDRTIVTIEEGVAVAWGTPWHGTCSMSSPNCAPIKRIFLLVQASRNRLVPLQASEAFGEAFVRVYQPTVEATEVLAVLETLQQIAALVPAAELHFVPTPGAYELARQLSAI